MVLKEGENRTVTAKLTRTEAIRGRVVGPDGSPAAGIKVRAFGSGQGMDNGQGQARTAADGSYEMNVNADEAYAVFVDDKDWAAPTRLDVVVREGQAGRRSRLQAHPGDRHPRDGHRRPRRPARAQPVHPARRDRRARPRRTCARRATASAREVRRQFGEMTDSAGHYSIRVGPGTYTLMGPPRTGNEKITIKDEAEVVRDFRMPRPEKGTITGRVVLAGCGRQGGRRGEGRDRRRQHARHSLRRDGRRRGAVPCRTRS